MNRAEAKTILLLYRTDADAADLQVAEALALAKQDPELARWFADYRAAQDVMREKFRQIAIPPALKEQIISERVAMAEKSRREKRVMAAAVAAIIIAVAVIGFFNVPRGARPADSFAIYQGQVMYYAGYGYSMDLATNDLQQVRDFFAQRQAPADFVLPGPLAQAAMTGCAVKDWNGNKVSMVCFRTGKPLAANRPGDLWLFVVDRKAVKNIPATNTPQFTQLDRVATVAWVQGDKLYILGTPGAEPDVRKYL